MIKVYIYRGIISHGLKFWPGTLILILYSALVLKDPQLLGIQKQYDPAISQDVLSFAALATMLCIVLLQFIKSYLLFFPSTYIVFGLDKIEFQEKFKKNVIIHWDEIQTIDLDIGDNRLLVLNIQINNGKIIKCYMTDLWLLSISKKWCVRHNFYRLMTIVGENEKLKLKLDLEQLRFLYIKTGIMR